MLSYSSFRQLRPFIFISLLLPISLLPTSCRTDQQATTDPQRTEAAGADSTRSGGTHVSLTQAQYTTAGIQLGQPASRSLHTTLKVNGVIDVPASNKISVSVPFGGYVRKIDLEPGMRVRKGQVLVVLENPDYIQLQQDYLDTKAKLDYADLDYARQEILSRENVNALKIFQQTRSTRQSLQVQLAASAQRLAMLHIDPVALSPDRLTRTVTVRAPTSGYITNVPVNVGRFVNPADVLVDITNMEHLHVQLNIFEKDIARIKTGQRVRFGMGGDASLMHQGDIFLIGKSLSPDRTVAVLAHPSELKPIFIPGGYVTAQIDVSTQPHPTLPETAVVSLGGKAYVYVLDRKENTAYHFRQVTVRTGVRENGYVAISLPADIDPTKTPVVVQGSYSLLSKLNNSEEEE